MGFKLPIGPRTPHTPSWNYDVMTSHSCVVGILIMMLAERKQYYMDRVKRIWYLSPMRAAKVQASLRIRAVSPEPSLLAHTSSESRGTFREKARSLAPLNGWACAVKVCHDGMLEDTNSLDGAHLCNKILTWWFVTCISLEHCQRQFCPSISFTLISSSNYKQTARLLL